MPGKDTVIIISHGMWQRRFGEIRASSVKTITLSGTPVTVIGVMPAGLGIHVRSRVLAAAGLVRQSDARRTLPWRDRASEARRHRPAGRCRDEDDFRAVGRAVPGRQRERVGGGHRLAGQRGRGDSAGAADAARRRGRGHPDCLRQCRQSPPGARVGPREGDRDSHRAWRRSAAADPSDALRERRPRPGWRQCRASAGVSGHSSSSNVERGQHSEGHQRLDRRLGAVLRARDFASRPASCSAWLPRGRRRAARLVPSSRKAADRPPPRAAGGCGTACSSPKSRCRSCCSSARRSCCAASRGSRTSIPASGPSTSSRFAWRCRTPPIPSSRQRVAFFDTLLDRLEALPEVTSAGMTQTLPMRGDYILSFTIQGQPAPKPNEGPSANYRVVSPNYFQALGIPLVRGRAFTERDGETVAAWSRSSIRSSSSGTFRIGIRLDRESTSATARTASTRSSASSATCGTAQPREAARRRRCMCRSLRIAFSAHVGRRAHDRRAHGALGGGPSDRAGDRPRAPGLRDDAARDSRQRLRRAAAILDAAARAVRASSRSSSPRSVSTASSPTPSASGRRRSGCAWPSARSAATSCGWSSAAG